MTYAQKAGCMLFALLQLIGGMYAFAAVPEQINYQGNLSDSGGTPLSGSQLINFNLYITETGGTSLWDEQQSVDVIGGIFESQLGSVTPFAGSEFENAILYLELAIFRSGSGWETLSPRQRLNSTAYAFKAGNSDMLEGYEISDLDAMYVNEGDGVVDSSMIEDGTIGSSDLGNDSVTSAEILDGTITGTDLENGAALAEIKDDDGAGSGLDADLLDGMHASSLMPVGTDLWVNTTGDVMTGDLSVTGDIGVTNSSWSDDDYTAVFESDGGTFASAIKGRASSTNGSALGLNLDVDSNASSGAGALINVNSLANSHGLFINSYSSVSSYGIFSNSRTSGDSSSPSTGIYSSTFHSGTGNLFGNRSYSLHSGLSGDTYGFYGEVAYGSDSGNSTRVYGLAHKYSSDTGGMAYGGYFVGKNNRDGTDDKSYGVFGEATGADGNRYGVYGKATTSGDTEKNFGVFAEASTSDYYAYGLFADVSLSTDNSNYGHGLHAGVTTDSSSIGVIYGVSTYVNHEGTSGASYGYHTLTYPSDTGNSYGLYAYTSGASSSGNAYGIYSNATYNPDNLGSLYAGYFIGNVHVAGTLSKTAGSFKIDHPLDPENKYLQHSFVESPDMKNVYDGTVLLDNHGEAWVQLPDYFGALNRDLRYQLTCIGEFAPVYIAEEVNHNRFRIAGGTAGMKVSWQITGIRQDAYAKAYPIEVEIIKDETERGSYLIPEVYGLDHLRSLEYALDPKMVKERMVKEKEHKRGTLP